MSPSPILKHYVLQCENPKNITPLMYLPIFSELLQNKLSKKEEILLKQGLLLVLLRGNRSVKVMDKVPISVKISMNPSEKNGCNLSSVRYCMRVPVDNLGLSYW